MREVPIDAEPHHSLRGWQAFRIGDSIVLSGREATPQGPFEELGSRSIEFFDSERALGIDETGVIWHIPEQVTSVVDVLLKREHPQEDVPPEEWLQRPGQHSFADELNGISAEERKGLDKK